jgi:hypothetical protein
MLAIKSKTGRINVARIAAPVFVFIILSSYAYASQSTITEAEGYACMGEVRTGQGDRQNWLRWKLQRETQ